MDRSTFQHQLRLAHQTLATRGLNVGAKVLAQLLHGLEHVETQAAERDAFDEDIINDTDQHPMGALEEASAVSLSNRYLLAKSYFDSQEYQRSAHLLADRTSTNEELFLKSYSLYLAGEKLKEQEIIELGDSMERSRVQNPNLRCIHSELSSKYAARELDGFGLYMFAIILRDSGIVRHTGDQYKKSSPDAISVLCEAVRAFPWNWSAWVDLSQLCTSTNTALPPSFEFPSQVDWVEKLFTAHAFLEMGGEHYCQAALEILSLLEKTFPQSSYILGQLGQAHYALRDYTAAQEVFERLRVSDPYGLEGMDTYSNILFAKESKPALSHLAHVAMKNDKYRPETCCIVGNYYGLKSQHDRAILYFRRALTLDRNYASAWTLIGHEYVEMKNTGAAIEAYRRGVEINPRDHTAWYGLGQTYEMLAMYRYALYYFRKAVKLQPSDYRMWYALGHCYKHLKHIKDAVACFERACMTQDEEGTGFLELARIFSDSDKPQAAKNYEKLLELRDQAYGKIPNDRTVEALHFLVKFNRIQNDLKAAATYCSRLLEFGGSKEEWAKVQLRELETLLGHKEAIRS